MSATKKKKAETDVAHVRLHEELHQVIVGEFLEGATVSWWIGDHKQVGTVERAPEHWWESVTVRNTKTGKVRKIEATDLEVEP